MPETDTSAKNPLHVSEVDDNLKELSPHGSFELPVETYMANCEIFHALYDHWHSEMEIMYIEKGSGFARLNRESIRLKKGDILIVNWEFSIVCARILRSLFIIRVWFSAWVSLQVSREISARNVWYHH